MFRWLALALFVFAALFLSAPFYQRLLQPNILASATPAATPIRIAAAAPPPTGQSVRVELSEQQVNQLLRDGLTRRGYQVNDLVVHLEEGRFVATTSQQVSLFRVPVTVVGEAGIVDGQLSVRPVSVSAAGASVPQSLVDQLAATFRAELANGIEGLPVRPTNVQLKPGRLIVDGVPK